MRTVVSLQDLLEFEIRPGPLLREYQRLTEAAVRAWPASMLREVSCPACAGAAAELAFERFGLPYKECARCATVYLSPRPDERTLAEYARTSAPAVFWRERVLPETDEARREKILLPRTEWVQAAMAEYTPEAVAAFDLTPNGGPMPAGPVHALTAFETFDRTFDPRALARAAHAALEPGGLLFVTGPSVSGFELQVLWERAATVAPPDKINLLSVGGYKALFAEGWELIELSTPGMFDVESVRRAVLAEPAAPWPRFVRTLVLEADEQQRLELQEYLQRARLASFARVLVRKV